MSTTSSLDTATIVANQTTAKLQKAAIDLQKVAEGLGTAAEAHSELVNQIAAKQAELQSLEIQFGEAKRSKTVELELDLKQNKLDKANAIITELGKVVIDKTDYDKLQSELNALKTSYNEALDAQLNAAKAQHTASLNAALRHKELELQVKSAQVEAQVASLTDKNTLLSKQVADLQGQITAERQARVEEAKARGNAMVTVQSGK